MVLAGGLGTRLRSVVADRPKVLAEIAGRPFLTFILDQLAEAGCREVVLCTGYQADQVERAFGNRYLDMRLAYSRENAQLGTGGALRLALPLIQAEECLVMNGDSYCAASLAELATWHETQAAVASLLLTRVPDTSRYGRVETSPAGEVRAFREKANTVGEGLINAGVYVLRSALLESIPANEQVSLERDVFPRLIGAGLYGRSVAAPFIDIGVPDSYAAADAFFGALAA
jgi:D-glycero-alpha-D-manno-heptose 1-phosphate guanylyltransferase